MGIILSIAITLAILGAAAGFEGIAAGRAPKAFLDRLSQPSWAPPFPVWIVIALVFYAVFGSILFRMIRSGEGWALAGIGLVVALLCLNVVWNYLFFRRRDLVAAYRLQLPYGALLATLFGLLLLIDRIAAFILLVYIAYLPFAVAWMRALNRLNPVRTES